MKHIKEVAEEAVRVTGEKTIAYRLAEALLDAVRGFEEIQACLGPDHTCLCEGLDAESEMALEVANKFLEKIEETR